MRLDNVRHSYASRAFAPGEGLQTSGWLLGHDRIGATAECAHLVRGPSPPAPVPGSFRPGPRRREESPRAMAMQQKTLSNRAVEAPTVERDTVFWDRDLTGSMVRAYPSGCKPRRAGRRGRSGSQVGRNEVLNANQARRRAALITARIKAGEGSVALPLAARLNGPLTVADRAERYLEWPVAVRLKPRTQ